MKKITNKKFNKIIFPNKVSTHRDFQQSVIFFKIKNDDVFSIEKTSLHYKINKNITSFILSDVPTNSCSVGFKKGFGYLDFFKPHLNGIYFLRLDIKKFFHSIPNKEIEDALRSIFPELKGSKDLSPFDIALKATTYNVPSKFPNEKLRDKIILPMGFPSSPSLSNIIFRRIDILILKECERLNVHYSRYADDMLFSSSNNIVHKESFISEISYLISLLDLKLNYKKIVKAKYKISLNGYTIDTTHLKLLPSKKELENEKPKTMPNKNIKIGELRPSNKILKKYVDLCWLLGEKEAPEFILKKIFNENLNNVNVKYGNKTWFIQKYAMSQLRNKLIGSRSYLISFLKFDDVNHCISEQKRKKISDLIELIEKNIN